jgi:DNA-binding transcriptional MerR regulator
MKPLIPDHLKDAAFMAGKAGSFSDVPLRTVQFWTERGLVKPDIADTTGTGSKRQYSVLNCIEIAIIKFLTNDRMSLDHVKQLMDAFRQPVTKIEGSDKYVTMLETMLEQSPGYLIFKYDQNRIFDIYTAFQKQFDNPEFWQSETAPAEYDKVVVLNLGRIARRVLDKMG